MKRDIIKIDEDLCNGCGDCVPNCHEGALQVIDGKARLVNDHLCDGLGACIGHCPEGAITIEKASIQDDTIATLEQPSELRQWPVQLHLVNPQAPYFKSADLLLAADCVAFSMGGFHSNHLKGKSLAIACPKLDQGTDSYVEKLTAMIDNAKVNTITVMMMEVPCCGGLLNMVRSAMVSASRKVPVKKVIVGINGEVLQEVWV